MRLLVWLQNNCKNDATKYSGSDNIKHFGSHHEPKELIYDIRDGFDFHAAKRQNKFETDVKMLNFPVVN